MNHGTYLLRNRPELELIYDLASSRPKGSCYKVCVLGCSVGMEVYSIKWILRHLAPQQDIQMLGSELGQAALDTARAGKYPQQESSFAPVTDKLADIHDGDPSLREGWPWETWGLEPMDTGRTDWVTRYSMVYHNV